MQSVKMRIKYFIISFRLFDYGTNLFYFINIIKVYVIQHVSCV